MIERYSRPEMTKIWSEEHKFKTWLTFEIQVLKILGQKGWIPKEAAAEIEAKAFVDLERMKELEAHLHHDVIAFTTSVAEQVGAVSRFFHFGLTSSDVVDSCLSLLMSESLNLLLDGMDQLLESVKLKAVKTKNLVAMGRTHGVHAEPFSFGQKFLGWYAELHRQKIRLSAARDDISYGKCSGAVGAYGVLTPELEAEILEPLGLHPEPVATQVIPRDRHAVVMTALAQLGGTVERIALELRHLQRTEVGELEEGFGVLQKGSSAMPHKKNPISAENLTGCARLLRGYCIPALENMALWHERDISHSSVERVVLADAFILADYMLHRLTKLLSNLKINEDRIKKNLHSSGRVFLSGHVLLELVKKGVSREDGYRWVQKVAHEALAQNRDYLDLLKETPEVMAVLSLAELGEIFRLEKFLTHVDALYTRVFAHAAKVPQKS